MFNENQQEIRKAQKFKSHQFLAILFAVIAQHI
jgi:hypothetical protein